MQQFTAVIYRGFSYIKITSIQKQTACKTINYTLQTANRPVSDSCSLSNQVVSDDLE